MNLPRGLVIKAGASFATVLLAVVMFLEGCSLTAYRDTGGVWTICYGHTAGVKAGDVATREQCVEWLWQDLQTAIAIVDREVKTEPPMLCRVAVVSFVFNTGRLRGTTLLKRLNASDWAGAAAEFPRWVYVGPLDCRAPDSNCRGIVTRRALESELCLP